MRGDEEGGLSENSKIEWTDNTFNPWVGCTKISPACDFCYAEGWAKRTGQSDLWHGDRRRTSTANWRQPLKWDKEARRTGYAPWVFCASLADVFDNEIPLAWREDLWQLISNTPSLRWQLLTKRIGNVAKMLPEWWANGRLMRHVGVMATIANQEEAERDIPKLLALKAQRGIAWIGISYEPALGPLDLYRVVDGGVAELDWVVAGGESGPKARPAASEWFRDVRDQCSEMGIAFLFKQWGEWLPLDQAPDDLDRMAFAIKSRLPDGLFIRTGKKIAGRLLEGREWNEMPRIGAAQEVAA